MNPWQIFANCEHCRTESAVIEVFDPLHPATHLGTATHGGREQRFKHTKVQMHTAVIDEPASPRLSMNLFERTHPDPLNARH